MVDDGSANDYPGMHGDDEAIDETDLAGENEEIEIPDTNNTADNYDNEAA